MSKKIFLTILTIGCLLTAHADEALWMRYAAISPDGTRIAFCYKGDIYVVPATGGTATQLTSQQSYECHPVWSPDGSQIAFNSDRKGNFDVYIMNSYGGQPKRLTMNSASETPWAFSPDGKYVYFSACIQDPASSALFPSARLTELYKVPVAGGKVTRELGTPAEYVRWNAAGTQMIYQDNKGTENEWRKHHTSSVTRDIWVYDAKTGHHRNLTSHAGEDRNPVWSADGNTAYFLSERNGGSMNVYSMSATGGNLTQITNFDTNPVRFLSIADDGTLCFTQDGCIYTMAQGGQPRKVSVNLWHDDSDQIQTLTHTSGATEATVSPNGKQVAMVIRGDVFVTSTDYTTTKRITNTAAAEKSVSWGSDNRTLAYCTERNGNWELVIATIGRKDDPNFANATLINEEIILPSTTVERTYPQLSPDGKKLAFIEDRFSLKVVDLKTKKVTTVTDGSTWYETNGGFNYSWSPDGKWFALEFIGNQRDPYSDIGIVSAEGGPITNITQSAYISESPSWVMEGNAIMFKSNRYGLRSQASWGSQDDVFLAFVNQDALDRYNLNKEDYELLTEAEKEAKKAEEKKQADEKDKKKGKKDDKSADKKEEKKGVKVELDDINYRIVRVTPNSSDIGGAYITNDGSSLYYLSRVEKGYDLWKMDLRKHETKLLNKMAGESAGMEATKDGKELFILGSRKMQKLTISNDKLTGISYSAEQKLDYAAEREYMFNHVAKQIDKRFYNLSYHGCDWKKYVEIYRKFLPHINNNYDYAEMLSELLGELNCSHSGSGYRPNGKSEATAQLGALYDWQYTGKGLKIEKIIMRGPLAVAKSAAKPGVIIEKINGVEIDEENDYTALLNGTAGKKTLISFYDPRSGKRWEEVIKPITAGAQRDLLYNAWVLRNEHIVDSLSGGRLGYVHLKSMNDQSYRTVYSQILGKYNKKEGIVIDTRFNGGGRLHEDIETLFSGKKYFTQVIRGREACDMPSRRWNKPSIMLQCEANYSNAHGTPWVYSHQKIGKLVGMPVPGTMSSVSWETLQDQSLYFGVPIIGYRLPDGSYLENQQLEPDIKVANDPEVIVTGRDQQLETAVRELLNQL